MVLARFLPNDERFFEYFRDAATNARDSAALLRDIVETNADIERKVRKLRDLEHIGDEITHQVFNALNSTFVTPIDREDIQRLTSELDEFVDYIEEAARRMYLYKVGAPTEISKLLVRVIDEQAEILANSIPLLESAKKRDTLLRNTVEIHRLENEGDDILNQAMAHIYDDVPDIPSLIKAIRWSELYQLLEDATDRAEDIANALEGIVLKNA
ncbi:protein of unknown function DUF47 [Thermobaculum terrenum ATCC BAA-798]|uniref:Phosphate transport regulator n=1 Tax=Thermobaculum terrenum (strain ATCC BAA-798 / CCMEE 7001 / YNP1) TaxID=525904 RepID=D1CDP4_THET1|nr:DUF47 family protein [Thermobaculum terrenum]ACZ41050.1 protein of unknown function DUF47 [Thermobaculum terrenum ATCC BAA-798]